MRGSGIDWLQLVNVCLTIVRVHFLCCVECGPMNTEFDFRGAALLPLDEVAEADLVAREGDGSETRRPSPGAAAPHPFLQPCDHPIALTSTQETAVQTEVM